MLITVKDCGQCCLHFCDTLDSDIDSDGAVQYFKFVTKMISCNQFLACME